jgi:DNA modification methylase
MAEVIQPYYQDDSVTIYNADCREVLPTLDKVDLVLTDPPYGIGRDGKPPSTSSHGGHKGYEFMGWDTNRPSCETFERILSAASDSVIWGGNYFADFLPPQRGWLVWDKGQRIDQADGELAWSTQQTPLRIYTLNRVAIANDGAVHPTQKPRSLMRWCIGFFPDAQTILDPFMGSGTTLRAAKDLNRKAIGIEIEERYCEIAAKRMSQLVMELK